MELERLTADHSLCLTYPAMNQLIASFTCCYIIYRWVNTSSIRPAKNQPPSPHCSTTSLISWGRSKMTAMPAGTSRTLFFRSSQNTVMRILTNFCIKPKISYIWGYFRLITIAANSNASKGRSKNARKRKKVPLWQGWDCICKRRKRQLRKI